MTKQRMLEWLPMMRALYPGENDEWLLHVADINHDTFKNLVSWSDRQSSASAAAALRMAAETIKRNWNDQSSAEDILALITPDQSAALALMVEGAERRGVELGGSITIEMCAQSYDRLAVVRWNNGQEADAEYAENMAKAFRSHVSDSAGSVLSAHDARVREEAIEEIEAVLLSLGYLKGSEIIPAKNPGHARFGICQDCGYHHDDGVCSSNELLEKIRAIKAKGGPGNG